MSETIEVTKEELFEVYKSGFKSSGEGWNWEYPVMYYRNQRNKESPFDVEQTLENEFEGLWDEKIKQKKDLPW